MNLPETRRDLVVQDLRDEVLISDKSTNKSYCLNSTARTVFNACDGAQTFADVGLPEDVIYFALDKLQAENLLAGEYVSPYAGMNRREVIRKIGFASMIALPIISSLVAPPAVSAQSRVCPSAFGPDDPNGINGNGETCLCNGGGNSSFSPCNTSRGGDGITPTLGCRTGCFCRSSDVNQGTTAGRCS